MFILEAHSTVVPEQLLYELTDCYAWGKKINTNTKNILVSSHLYYFTSVDTANLVLSTTTPAYQQLTD